MSGIWNRIVDRGKTAGLGMFVIGLFVCTIAVFITVAMVRPKDHRLDTLIAFSGAAGQIFFAGAVYKLSKAQFAFTKQVAARQHRIDTFDERKEVEGQIQELMKVLDNVESTARAEELFLRFYLAVDRVFDADASERAFNIYQNVIAVSWLKNQAGVHYDFMSSISGYDDESKYREAGDVCSDTENLLIELGDVIHEQMKVAMQTFDPWH